MSTICGLRSKPECTTIPPEQESKHQRPRADEYEHRRNSTDARTPETPKRPNSSKLREEPLNKENPKGKQQQSPTTPSPKEKPKEKSRLLPRPLGRRQKSKSIDFQLSKEDRLSMILESLDGSKESRRSTSKGKEKEKKKEGPRRRTSLGWGRSPRPESFKRTRFLDQPSSLCDHQEAMSSSRTSPRTPRPIEAPPTDVSFLCPTCRCVLRKPNADCSVCLQSSNPSLASTPPSSSNISPWRMHGFLDLRCASGCCPFLRLW